MKLIDKDTGHEYEGHNCYGEHYSLTQTGKRYEVREGYGDNNTQFITTINDSQRPRDTHRALVFLEPIEQPNPMPETLEQKVERLEKELGALQDEIERQKVSLGGLLAKDIMIGRF